MKFTDLKNGDKFRFTADDDSEILEKVFNTKCRSIVKHDWHPMDQPVVYDTFDVKQSVVKCNE